MMITSHSQVGRPVPMPLDEAAGVDAGAGVAPVFGRSVGGAGWFVGAWVGGADVGPAVGPAGDGVAASAVVVPSAASRTVTPAAARTGVGRKAPHRVPQRRAGGKEVGVARRARSSRGARSGRERVGGKPGLRLRVRKLAGGGCVPALLEHFP